jgi:hypothetical protein
MMLSCFLPQGSGHLCPGASGFLISSAGTSGGCEETNDLHGDNPHIVIGGKIIAYPMSGRSVGAIRVE